MKFKVGDKVRILDGRKSPSCKVRWQRSMDKFVGCIGTVKIADSSDGTYRVAVGDDSWWYAEEWLEEPLAFKGGRSCGKTLSVVLSMSDKIYSPRRIYKGNGKLVALWADGTKTVVSRAEGEPDSDYAAFTAALAIKIYGSNSAVNRIVRTVEKAEKKRKKPEEPQKETPVTKIEFTISPETVTISREEV